MDVLEYWSRDFMSLGTGVSDPGQLPGDRAVGAPRPPAPSMQQDPGLLPVPAHSSARSQEPQEPQAVPGPPEHSCCGPLVSCGQRQLRHPWAQRSHHCLES